MPAIWDEQARTPKAKTWVNLLMKHGQAATAAILPCVLRIAGMARSHKVTDSIAPDN
jgi:hypothetical protein